MLHFYLTSGDMTRDLLQEKEPGLAFLPFREAMIRGSRPHTPFSPDFIASRARTHGVTQEQYTAHMQDFLSLLGALTAESTLHLYFGLEPFCAHNLLCVLAALECRAAGCAVLLHPINEQTGEPDGPPLPIALGRHLPLYRQADVDAAALPEYLKGLAAGENA